MRWLAVIFVVLAGTVGAQEPVPPPKQPELPAPPRPPEFPTPPPSARAWRSQTTGKEYRVWIEGSRLYAEWVNIAAESRRRGAYIRTECRRTGTRWIGTSHSYLPCEREGNNRQDYNWCPWVTKIVFERVEANRMSGRAEGFRRFDCDRCRILETVWKDFEWVPKGPPTAPVPIKKSPGKNDER
jgi:hypothetical protein